MTAFRRLVTWIQWIVRAIVFFILLAFALNNQQQATLHLMFGHEWRAPMTLIVLAAFALGLVVGVLGMLPGWWRRRARAKTPARTVAAPAPQITPPDSPAPSSHTPLPAREL